MCLSIFKHEVETCQLSYTMPPGGTETEATQHANHFAFSLSN